MCKLGQGFSGVGFGWYLDATTTPPRATKPETLKILPVLTAGVSKSTVSTPVLTGEPSASNAIYPCSPSLGDLDQST